MPSILCCSSINPYRPKKLDHEPKFNSFMSWAKSDPTEPANGSSIVSSAPYVVQLVRQINYGRRESIRYFIPDTNSSAFLKATEQDLIQANFEKLNSFKNFRCAEHNKFFEVNLYQKDPVNTHHWRANMARPAGDIDLEHAASLPEPHNPPSTSHQPSEVELQEISSAQLSANSSTNLSTLKPILRFLLAETGAGLGSNSLMSLLCLDWVNRELDLDLDYGNVWEDKLTSSNISIFLHLCIDPSDIDMVDITELEDLVVHEMDSIDAPNDQQALGRAKLEIIVNRVLDSNRSARWVSRYGDRIRHALTSGPNEELLVSCMRKDGKTPANQLREITFESDARRPYIRERFFVDDHNDDYERSYDYDSWRDSGEAPDYAACDRECGYCGKCDY
ncbi:hypothetical protein F4825DRAFT_435465 [Nemania diffusa]|nr:hypothetical protein F4825DRAFT_435465 [Nemania diffusa]